MDMKKGGKHFYTWLVNHSSPKLQVKQSSYPSTGL
jgi:hypothetical protein